MINKNIILITFFSLGLILSVPHSGPAQDIQNVSVNEQAEMLSQEILSQSAERPINPRLDILEAREESITNVLKIISEKTGITIITPQQVNGVVTIYLKDIDVFEALKIILDMNDLAFYEENGNVYVISSEEYHAKFGKSFSDSMQTRNVMLKYIPVDEVLPLLEQMKSERGRILSDEHTDNLILIDLPEKIQTMMSLISEWDVPLFTQTFTLRHLSTDQIKSEIALISTPKRGIVTTDSLLKQITVTDTSAKIKEMTALIESLDNEAKQFIIDAKVIQIILNDEHQEGVDWEAIVSNYSQMTFPSIKEISSLNTREGISVGALSEEDYKVLLEALETVGVVHTTAHMSKEAQNASETSIDVRLLDPSIEDNSQGKERIHIENEVRFLVRPEEGAQDIVVYLAPYLESAAPFSQGKDSWTLLHLKAGETIVIGGMFNEVAVESTRKIPLLGDLPIVGFAFRNQGERLRKAEVVVFMTVKMIVKEEVPRAPQ